jgi:FkbM family methyltransferase
MLPRPIRKLSCNPFLRGIAHRLRVTRIARNLYCKLLARNGELRITCLGVEAVFKSRNTKQLAFVDYILTTEGNSIESVLRHLRTGDTFLDVGSHYGIYSVLASKLVGPTGKVIAVEPHPGAVQVLRENLTANYCQNVQVLHMAFSDKAGPLVLNYHANGAGLQPAVDASATMHTIEGVAGDDALSDFPSPAAVKIDVEGLEFAVLSGLKQTLSNRGCRLLSVEVHPSLLPAAVDQDKIMSFIRDRGFKNLSQTNRSAEMQVMACR